jgi:CO dehydrogenase maturation factor
MLDSNKNNTRIIALCGKGGVGKTSISALMTKILVEQKDKKVLAIDADPAVGLSTALGIKVSRTVDDIRNDLIQRIDGNESIDRDQILSWIDYEMLQAIEEHENLCFLAIGRPETEGCYCQVNHILKDIITSLSQQFDYVVIDGEAGIEQVNRRVMEKVSHLVLVSDQSQKGIQVVKTIQGVCESVIDYESCGLVLNKIRTAQEAENIFVPEELTMAGWLPETEDIRNFDMAGQSILKMPNSKITDSLRSCMYKLGILEIVTKNRNV